MQEGTHLSLRKKACASANSNSKGPSPEAQCSNKGGRRLKTCGLSLLGRCPLQQQTDLSNEATHS
eukprot:12923322-Prorocentrum_lima.AAC.1